MVLAPAPAEAIEAEPITGPDPMLGLRVGNFQLVKRLGAGGMGSVYLAENPLIGSRVAVKFLHPTLAQNAEAVRRFYAEGRAANIVAHANIVRVLDLGLLSGVGYFLMLEYVEGQTLADRIAQGPVPLAWAEAVLSQICSGLSVAHARGVVHRDLKPDNVLLVEHDGLTQVKLTDFGVAKLREDAAGGATRAGEVMGTPEYMAPEQCEGAPADARADIYALGVMAYELATGTRPFNGAPGALLLAHLSRAPQAPSAHRRDLPPHWNDAILRALSKKPEDRFPSVDGFLAALRGPVAEAPPAPKPMPPPVPLEVWLDPAAPQTLPARDLSRGGALVELASPPPPLFATMKVALGRGAARLELQAEVVRHVSAAEARAWGRAPGFALQFLGAPPITEALASAAERPPPPSALSADERALLARLLAADPTGPYALLELPLDAAREEVLARGTQVQTRLQELALGPLTALEQVQLRAAQTRAAEAVQLLSTPLSRLRLDAALRNPHGVARCFGKGLTRADVEREHAAYRKAHPEAAAQAEVALGRWRLAQRNGQAEAAARELEAALTADPLNPELHALRVRQQRGP
jgi:serine/threonine-protein kinase